MERGGGRGEGSVVGGSAFSDASVFRLVFVFVFVFALLGGASARAGGASASAFEAAFVEGEEEEEELRYRLTSDTIVLVLLCRGFSFAKEREGWVVMWVRTSWLVRVADCVSRICGGQGVSWLDGWRSGFGGEGRPSCFWGG